MKFPAPTHPSHLRSPAIHIHLPEAPRARCVMRRKRTREEEGSCLRVRVQRGSAWWDGQLWRQYQEHVTAWPYQLPIPSFQGTGSTGEREEAQDSYRQERLGRQPTHADKIFGRRFCKEAAIWYNPNLVRRLGNLASPVKQWPPWTAAPAATAWAPLGTQWA